MAALSETTARGITADDLLSMPDGGFEEEEEKVFDRLDAGTRMVVVNPRKRSGTVYRSRSDIVVLREADTLEGGRRRSRLEAPGRAALPVAVP